MAKNFGSLLVNRLDAVYEVIMPSSKVILHNYYFHLKRSILMFPSHFDYRNRYPTLESIEKAGII